MSETEREAVVLRYRDGRTERCQLATDFSPRDLVLEVHCEEDGVKEISVLELKAVFFLKDPRRRSADMALSDRPQLPGSAMARVEFFDGEIIRGRVQHYSVANAGFFLYPSAPDSNNDRIFVVATALNTVAIEG